MAIERDASLSSLQTQLQCMLDKATNSSVNIREYRYWTLVTAFFSQITWDHLLSNLLCLAAFARPFYNAGGVSIGALHVVGLTFGSAVLGSLTSIVYRRSSQASSSSTDTFDARKGVDLGASDVVLAFATVATCLRPRSRFAVGLFFLPSWMYWVAGSMVFWDLTLLGRDDRVGYESYLTLVSYTIWLPSGGVMLCGELLPQKRNHCCCLQCYRVDIDHGHITSRERTLWDRQDTTVTLRFCLVWLQTTCCAQFSSFTPAQTNKHL